MKKAILMSIQPKWLVKILNGEKTIEIRKTMPKCELPIDVYLYCSKAAPNVGVYQGTISKKKEYGLWHLPFGDYVEKYGDKNGREIDINGKVVAKFTLNKVEEISLGSIDEFGYDEFGYDEYWPVDYETKTMMIDDLLIKSCLSYEELHTYLDNTEKGYAWHIDNLVIFDKPKDLSEFLQFYGGEESFYELKKAPQSWQYVYVKGE